MPSEELLSAARLLLEAAPSAIVLAFTGPEIAVELPDGAALICCYDGSEPSQRAGVDALFGESPVSGRLPVDVPPRFKMGHGLMR